MIKPVKFCFLLILLLTVFFHSRHAYAQQNTYTFNSSMVKPLHQALNPDGSIKNNLNVNGSYNTEGYKLHFFKDGSPRFVKSASVSPDDVRWSSRFSVAGTEDVIYCMTVNGNDLYIGGAFTTFGKKIVNHIARWDGSTWHSLGEGENNGVGGSVHGIAVVNNKVFVGGTFATAGTLQASGVAWWDGAQWNTLNSGDSNGVMRKDLSFNGDTILSGGSVYSMAVKDDLVIMSGFFNYVKGSSMGSVTAWNISQGKFVRLKEGIANEEPEDPAYGYTMFVNGQNLYIGGKFTRAGTIAASMIARYNFADSTWNSLNGGVNNWVNAIDMASNGDLYVGGLFDSVGVSSPINANGVAKWNGTSWSPLGAGIQPYVGSVPEVKSLKVVGSDVYVGGTFITAGSTPVNGIAKWNGSVWSSPAMIDYTGPVSISTVRALALHSGDQLYAAGNFDKVGFTPAVNIVQLDLANNFTLQLSGGEEHSGIYDGTIETIVSTGTDIYAGGTFYLPGGTYARSIAKWDGNLWSSLGDDEENGINGVVSAIAIDGSNIYVGGTFGLAGTDTAYHIAKWDGTGWSSMGIGVGGVPNPRVSAIAFDNDYVYIGGIFEVVGDDINYALPVNHIARWSKSQNRWDSLSTGMTGTFLNQVNSLYMENGTLYAGGYFTQAGAEPVNNLAKWNGTSWSSIGSAANGIEGIVYTVKVKNGIVYAAGDIQKDGKFGIFKYESNTWSPLGGGVTVNDPFSTGRVHDFHFQQDDIYVTGYFDHAGTTSADNIAKWDGTSWSPLGSGVGFAPFKLASMGNKLFVGGGFVTAGSKPAISITTWDINPTGITDPVTVVKDYALFQNYPNPFNPVTTIKFSIPKNELVQLKIFDITGREISTLINSYINSGTYTVPFNGTNLSSGIYFYELKAGSFTNVMKMVLVK